ncbi:hypothetical protein D7T02_41355, partial [Burkholderia cepacia]|nr:hypothetical protein [Burkholderia cepacia]MBA9998484.1 hypothetical protein [Burkholderia cepacia]MBB0006456.1 hypothetical protein [Burkholderia cepacia]MBB0050450.1 hypothetical protein [Burkholderia cepacia]MBB0058851.1 hypothetical protein [Burkholderia cepacia]
MYATNVTPADNPTKTNNGSGANNSANIGNAFPNPTNTTPIRSAPIYRIKNVATKTFQTRNLPRETLINGPTSEVAGEMASNFLDDE